MIFPNPSSTRSQTSLDGKNQEMPLHGEPVDYSKHNAERFQEAFNAARANPRGSQFAQTNVPDVVPLEQSQSGGPGSNDQTPRGQFLGKFSFARNSLPPNGHPGQGPGQGPPGHPGQGHPGQGRYQDQRP